MQLALGCLLPALHPFYFKHSKFNTTDVTEILVRPSDLILYVNALTKPMFSALDFRKKCKRRESFLPVTALA